MHVCKSWSLIGVCAALAGACGDPMNTSASGTGGEDSTGGNPPVTSTTSDDPTTGGSATTGDGSGSESDGKTTSGSSGSIDDTTGAETTDTPETSSGTSTTGVDDTTGGDTTTAGTTDTTGGDTGDEMCVLAQMHLPCDAESNDVLHALGINCTTLGGEWVDGANAVAVVNGSYSFQAPPEMLGKRTWQVARSYGTYVDPNTQKPFWSPREGDKILMISSGLLPPPNNAGAVIIDDGDVYNDTVFGGQWDSDSMPPPMSPQKGSPDPMGFANCNGKDDCSNTLFDQWNLGFGDPEDKMWFSFKLKAPALADGDMADAKGYSFDFAYFSAEFPEFVDDIYNDMFVVWQASEDYTGNVTFVDGQPMTVTALWPIDFEGECLFGDPQCQGSDPHLEGTGHIADGGATGWYKATSGVKPGETFTLAFAVFDMGDSTYDTTALLDNWIWDCEGCIPNEVNSCGIEPQ